jgi:hypothetical protein
MPLHPQAQAIADLYAAVRKTPFENLSPVEARAVYNAGQIPSEEVVHEIREVDAGGIPCRLYRPSCAVRSLTNRGTQYCQLIID